MPFKKAAFRNKGFKKVQKDKLKAHKNIYYFLMAKPLLNTIDKNPPPYIFKRMGYL